MRQLILTLSTTILFGCNKPFTDYQISIVTRSNVKFVEYKYQNNDGTWITSDILLDAPKTITLKRIK